MNRTNIVIYTLFLAFLGWLIWILNLYNVDTQPQIREITLTDGTPCVINKNGGIACNWKNNAQKRAY